jgi:hypothetical protein
MLFARDYQKPFWRGFFHAAAIAGYSLFLAIVLLSLRRLFNGEIGPVIAWTTAVFLFLLSVAVIGYLIFFEPMKSVMHHHFRAATVMLGSTLGWLFTFLVIFLAGLVATL